MTAIDWTNRCVLVTGGYGFVASHLIKRLTEIGARCVTVLSERPGQSSLALSGVEQRVTVAHADTTAAGLVGRLVNEHDIEVVFHLAAETIVGAANRYPLSTLGSNIPGPYVLLEECRREWRQGSGPLRAVMFASSDKAYGEQPALPYTEDQPLNALHPYDVSKACTDLLARSYPHTYALPVAVTRCVNIYGPGDLNLSRIVPSVVGDRFRGTRPIVRSDGSPARDYLFVADAVSAYIALANAVMEGRGLGEAFNFGTGDPVSVSSLMQEIVHVAGRPHLEPDVQGTASGEVSRQYLDSAKATRLLRWCPQVTRPTGLAVTWQWYTQYLSSVAR